MKARKNILFLQLPQPDNAAEDASENLPLAAVYLRYALEESTEAPYFRVLPHLRGMDCLDDSHLIESVLRARPHVLAATLYLWNVERTLHLLDAVRRSLPRALILVGGPEVAPDHPFLFDSPSIDAAAVGEGEPVFPLLLSAWRHGVRTNLRTVAWRRDRRFLWGSAAPLSPPLPDLLPPPGYRHFPLTRTGIAYLETSRGCRWKCAFCAYNQRRRGVSCLPASDVLARVRAFRRRGVREFRFIDPTFNSNPEFPAILRRLAVENRRHTMEFFAEIRPETVTAEQASLLAAANVRAVEVGLQSLDPAVLRAVRRATCLPAARRGVRLLARARLRITLDVMCGLPRQTLSDLRRAIRWATSLRNVNLQFLHTLLLPGTELRKNRRRWDLHALPLPPYRVTRTASLSPYDIRRAELLARGRTGLQMDSPASRFVGTRLLDLFPEQVSVRIGRRAIFPDQPWQRGRMNRRALIFRGTDLFGARRLIARSVRQAMQHEPHCLWQFVLAPHTEEPLDLLDLLISEIDRSPPHSLDNMIVPPFPGRRHAARRLFVLLHPRRRYARSWIAAAEDLLASRFY